MKLGVKVIHCSERDTQITDRPKQVDEFVNTWSIEGFREEGTTTAEMGWGTHEKELPPLAYEHADGPRNQICLAQMGMNTWVRSWVPHYAIRGMVVRHGEAFTHLRPADRLGRRPGRLPAHGPLRLLPLRRGHRLAERTARLRLPAAAEAADHERRDHQRRRYPRRPADGPRLQLLVDRQRPEHRGVAAAGAAPERHDDAGGDLGGGGGDVDDREPGDAASACPTTCRTTTSWTSPSRTWASSSRCRPTGRRCRATRNVFDGYAQPSTRRDGSLAIQELPGRETATDGQADNTLQKLAREHGTPLFVVDHDVLRKNYAAFKKHLPRVQAYYAVKANSDPAIVQTLYEAGASFDVASMPEFRWSTRTSVLPAKERQDFIWDKIIYANPIKDNQTLEELDPYKPLVTYDNLRRDRQDQEVRAARRPGAAAQGAQHRRVVELSSKFGAASGRGRGPDRGRLPRRAGRRGPELPRRQPVHELRRTTCRP